MQKQFFNLVLVHYKNRCGEEHGYLTDLRENYFAQEMRGGNTRIEIALTYEEHDAQRVGSPEEAREFLHEAGLMSEGTLIPPLRKLVTAIQLVPIEYRIGNKQDKSIVACYA